MRTYGKNAKTPAQHEIPETKGFLQSLVPVTCGDGLREPSFNSDVFGDLERSGFEFRASGELLYVHPREKLTAEQAAWVKENKKWVLDVLAIRAQDASIVAQSEAGLFDGKNLEVKRK